MSKTNKPVGLYAFVCIFLISLWLLLPRDLTINLSVGGRQLFLNIPVPSGKFFFWGRRFNLKPDFRWHLDYQPGQTSVFQVGAGQEDIKDEHLNKLQNTLINRLVSYSNTPVKTRLIKLDGINYIVVETLPEFNKDELIFLLTLPGNLEFYIQKEEISEEDLILVEDWIEAFSPLEISEKNVRRARVSINPLNNLPTIALTLDDQGRSVLFRATRENRDKNLMVVLDGSILLLSPIQEPIHNGRISISGGRSLAQAELLSAILVGESLELDVQVPEEDDQVGDLDLENYFEKPRISFYDLVELELWQYHLLIMAPLLLLPLIIITFLYKKVGFFASLLLSGLIIISFAGVRLLGLVISYEVLVALVVIWLYLQIASLVFLKALICFCKDEEMRMSEVMIKTFSLNRAQVRRVISLLFLSVLVITAVKNSSYLGDKYSSVDFAQAIWRVSFMSVSLYVALVISLIDYFKKVEG